MQHINDTPESDGIHRTESVSVITRTSRTLLPKPRSGLTSRCLNPTWA